MIDGLSVLHVDAGVEWRGGQQQVLYLMEGLTQLGHDNQIATPPSSPLGEKAASEGLRVHSINMRGEWDLSAARSLLRLVDQERPEIIHFHDARSAGIGALIRVQRIPPIIVSRRVDFPIGRNPFSRRKYRRADAVVAVSNRIGDICLQAGILRERIAIVHDGIDIERFGTMMPKARARLAIGISPGIPIIGVVAALVNHKGHRYLLDAMPMVLEKKSDAHLVIAGDGPLRKSLESQSRQLGIVKAVTFLGQIEKVPEFLAAIDLFVLPSHMEGLCQALIEALAAGIPCIATRAGGIPDVIEDGRSGLLVPPRDPNALAYAVNRVLDDETLKHHLMDGGRLQAGNFTREKMVRQTVTVYKQALKQRAGQSQNGNTRN